MENIRIALVGNPNCGKTTMFNYLTGSSQYVGNWPGVTVEKKEGKLKQHKECKSHRFTWNIFTFTIYFRRSYNKKLSYYRKTRGYYKYSRWYKP